MSEELDVIDKSVVHVLSADHGQGVISNGYIFTATHCLDITLDEALTLGDAQLQKCITRDGQEFLADVLFAELRTDQAVLCCPDEQTYPKLAILYEKIVDDLGIELFAGNLPNLTDSPVAVRIRNKSGSGWVNGVITQQLGYSIFVEAESQVHGGASGGPILEATTGKLIGINSSYCESEETCEGTQPFLARSLPVWLAEKLYGSN